MVDDFRRIFRSKWQLLLAHGRLQEQLSQLSLDALLQSVDDEEIHAWTTSRVVSVSRAPPGARAAVDIRGLMPQPRGGVGSLDPRRHSPDHT